MLNVGGHEHPGSSARRRRSALLSELGKRNGEGDGIHTRWGRGFTAPPAPKESEGPAALCRYRPVAMLPRDRSVRPRGSTKNKHLLVIDSIPTRGFTAVVSVFMGTPPKKPFNCKSCLSVPGSVGRTPWAKSTGEDDCLLFLRLPLAVRRVI